MRRGTRIHQSSRSSTLDAPPDEVWAVVASGTVGPHWYADAAPLVFRDRLDRVVGAVAGPLVGPGSDRHRPPGRPLLAAGDRVGFWQVTHTAGHRLDLVADLRSPGEVRLRTRVDALSGGSEVVQEVSFAPDGLLGQVYMLADLPAREAVIELVHRRLLADIRAAVVTTSDRSVP